ncbi:glycosyltransferase [Acinetobacter indicus]|uniref:glycosyltransferase n=1 Tax=Acinetobacter indicus TaxID=756892 RepID=UPI001FA6D529|nr:glycosyltransferase [Acinetobacter indicus]UNW04349.1 glycosyltransferase [Acinetobacter indicus]
MSIPLISIIVPVYNTGEFLSQCIESLINQTYRNLEIILINDGSTDNSLTICKSFEEIDSRILVIDQNNQGVSRARNNGIKKAKGDYIGFVDSDDFVDPEMYKVLLNKIQLEESQCATLIDFTIRSPSQNVLESKSSVDNIEAIGELFLLRFPTSMWAYLYKAELVKNVYLSDDIHFFEDFEFNYNYFKVCEKISICEGEYYSYNSNPESINQQELNSKKLSCLKIFDKIKKDVSNLNNEDLNKRALFFKAHFIVSMILSFSSSSQKAQESFCMILRESIGSVSKQSFFYSKYIPLNYKLIVLLFYTSPVFAEKVIGFYKKFR